MRAYVVLPDDVLAVLYSVAPTLPAAGEIHRARDPYQMGKLAPAETRQLSDRLKRALRHAEGREQARLEAASRWWFSVLPGRDVDAPLEMTVWDPHRDGPLPHRPPVAAIPGRRLAWPWRRPYAPR